jgi:hypothetical protein
MKSHSGLHEMLVRSHYLRNSQLFHDYHASQVGKGNPGFIGEFEAEFHRGAEPIWGDQFGYHRGRGKDRVREGRRFLVEL